MTISDQQHVSEDAVQQAPTLREVKDGDQFSGSTTYNGNRTVTSVFSFKPHEGGPRYEKRVLFDFGGVTEEQLHLLAMYGVKVKVQAILRSLSREEMLNPQTLSTVDVLLDVVQSSNRPSGDPLDAAIRTLAKRANVTEDYIRERLLSDVAR